MVRISVEKIHSTFKAEYYKQTKGVLIANLLERSRKYTQLSE